MLDKEEVRLIPMRHSFFAAQSFNERLGLGVNCRQRIEASGYVNKNLQVSTTRTMRALVHPTMLSTEYLLCGQIKEKRQTFTLRKKQLTEWSTPVILWPHEVYCERLDFSKMELMLFRDELRSHSNLIAVT